MKNIATDTKNNVRAIKIGSDIIFNGRVNPPNN
jgi:hypothetical protein